jgi:hypothetical protein
VTRLRLTLDEDVVFRAIGAEAFMRARMVADRGALANVVWQEESHSARNLRILVR